MSSNLPKNGDTYVAPALAANNAWFGLKINVRFVLIPSEDNTFVAFNPSIVVGIFTTMFGWILAISLASLIIPSASVVVAFTSPLIAPSTIVVISLITSSNCLPDFDVAKEMITSVKKEFGSIDILVNNAGITKDNLIMRMSEEEFDKVIEVNLKGAFNCMKHVSRIMLKQKSGHIINMSSVSGVMGNAGQVNYCASKAGIIGMTKSLARELGSRGITVNAIAPGFIETEMTDVLPEDVKENLLASIPLKRMGQTKDIAETVAFLASDKAAYITGQTISVDGGMGM